MGLLLPYQKRIVEDTSQKVAVIAARQIGKTTASRVKIALDFLKGGGKDWFCASQDEQHAKIFLKDLSSCIKTLGALNRQRIDFVSNTTELKRNGKTVYSLSSNPDAQAGLVGNRYLDEFALHEHADDLWNVAVHGATWGGKMLVSSTPREQSGAFFNMVQNAEKYGISLHRVTLYDALNEGFLQKLKANIPSDSPIQQMDDVQYINFVKSSCLSDMSFRREMLCEWDGGDDGIVNKADVEAAMTGKLIDSKYVLGVDVGHGEDLTVITKLKYEVYDNELGYLFYIDDVWAKKTRQFSEIKGVLYQMMSENCLAVAIDATGLGAQIQEETAIEGAKRDIPVYKVVFTNDLKLKMQIDLKKTFENRWIGVNYAAFDWNRFVSDIISVKETITASTTKIEAKRGAGGHGDRFWSLALQIRAARFRGIY